MHVVLGFWSLFLRVDLSLFMFVVCAFFFTLFVSLSRPPYNFFTVNHSLSFIDPLPRGEGSRLLSELFLGSASKLCRYFVYALIGWVFNMDHVRFVCACGVPLMSPSLSQWGQMCSFLGLIVNATVQRLQSIYSFKSSRLGSGMMFPMFRM